MQATEQRVKLALEPMLETYRPPGFSSLTLDKFHLGKVPPYIDGKHLTFWSLYAHEVFWCWARVRLACRLSYTDFISLVQEWGCRDWRKVRCTWIWTLSGVVMGILCLMQVSWAPNCLSRCIHHLIIFAKFSRFRSVCCAHDEKQDSISEGRTRILNFWNLGHWA